MARKYTKMEILAEEVFRRKEAGETNRQIAESYGLTKYQIKQLVVRQNRKKRAIANGYVPFRKDVHAKIPRQKQKKQNGTMSL